MFSIPRTVCAVVVSLAAAVDASAETFLAHLSSAQQVPTVSTSASGYARIFVDMSGTKINFVVVFAGLGSGQTVADVHAPAALGAIGPSTVTLGTIGGLAGTVSGSARISPTTLAQLRAGQAYVDIHSVGFPGGEIRGQLARNRTVDFDGDGQTDYSVVRFPGVPWPNPLAPYTFYNLNSRDGFSVQQWGDGSVDTLAPGDYDGDGRDDFAVFRRSGAFFALASATGIPRIVSWGTTGDQSVSRDYDGDGVTDPAVFRPTPFGNATWYILQSSTSTARIVTFGIGGDIDGLTFGDVPVPQDYDGDGKADIAVYRYGFAQQPNTFYILRSSDGALQVTPWGNFSTDTIAGGDYDGDGRADIAVARAAVGSPTTWFILQSTTSTPRVELFGTSAGPVPGDYDGDGRQDLAVDASGLFWVLRSLTLGVSVTPWGWSTDVPLAIFLR